jgi:hypothetical protein
VARPSKLTPTIQKRIGDNITLGLTYRLAAESAGVTYKTLNDGLKGDRLKNLGNIISFINISKNVMLMPLKFFWNA